MYYGEPRVPASNDLELIEAAGHIALIAIQMERAQAALRESDERFRLAAKSGKMFAYEWDIASDVIKRSGESAPILGIDEETPFTGQQAISKVHLDDRERLKATVNQLSPESPYLQINYRMVRPDGTLIWVERSGRAFFNDEGKMLRVVGMVLDITERKLVEAKLQEYERAVEGAEEMIMVVDREYRYLVANNKFLKMRNMTREQVLGRFAHEVLHKEVWESVKDKLDESFRGKVVRFEMKNTYPELGERDILTHS
jgi:PAS domain S-box-containing protein